MVREPAKADSPAWSRSRFRSRSNGLPGTLVEGKEAATVSSGFGVPHSMLPEETPQETGVLFSQTSVLQSHEPVSTLVATYRNSLGDLEEVWTETQANLLETISSWKPLKEVSQEDLD